MTTPRTAMQEVAPQLADVTSNVLFGDIWERPRAFQKGPKPDNRGQRWLRCTAPTS